MFDVTMHGTMDLLFIRDSLEKKFGKGNVGLYRDADRLALLTNKTARAGYKTRKNLINYFGEFGLKVTAQTSQKITNFLHITLNLFD